MIQLQEGVFRMRKLNDLSLIAVKVGGLLLSIYEV